LGGSAQVHPAANPRLADWMASFALAVFRARSVIFSASRTAFTSSAGRGPEKSKSRRSTIARLAGLAFAPPASARSFSAEMLTSPPQTMVDVMMSSPLGPAFVRIFSLTRSCSDG